MITVLRFTAKWCQHCQVLAPIMEELAREFQHVPDVVFEVVDVENNPDMGNHFKIRSIPTVLILNSEDEILQNILGVHPKQFYIDAIKAKQGE